MLIRQREHEQQQQQWVAAAAMCKKNAAPRFRTITQKRRISVSAATLGLKRPSACRCC